MVETTRPLPEMLGPYRPEKLLGEGGMGTVWLAQDTHLERPVALKIVRQDLAGMPDLVERLKREARAAARLNHPHIVAVHAFGEQDGICYIALEYIEGRDAGALIRETGKLEPEEGFRIAEQTAKALRFASVSGIVHRDIKPSNLMITSDGTVKVADFGLARDLRGDAALTSTGTFVGSPAFMAPEQTGGGMPDFRTDIYALGCTLWCCLTGRPPFTGETPMEVLVAHCNKPLPEPQELKVLCGGRAFELLRRMLAKDPRERCSSWDEVIDELDALQRISRGELTAKPAAKRRLPVPLLAGLPAIALFALFSWLVLSGSGPEVAPAAPLPPPAAAAEDARAFSAEELAAAVRGLDWDKAERLLADAPSAPEAEMLQDVVEQLASFEREVLATASESPVREMTPLQKVQLSRTISGMAPTDPQREDVLAILYRYASGAPGARLEVQRLMRMLPPQQRRSLGEAVGVLDRLAGVGAPGDTSERLRQLREQRPARTGTLRAPEAGQSP